MKPRVKRKKKLLVIKKKKRGVKVKVKKDETSTYERCNVVSFNTLVGSGSYGDIYLSNRPKQRYFVYKGIKKLTDCEDSNKEFVIQNENADALAKYFPLDYSVYIPKGYRFCGKVLLNDIKYPCAYKMDRLFPAKISIINKDNLQLHIEFGLFGNNIVRQNVGIEIVGDILSSIEGDETTTSMLKSMAKISATMNFGMFYDGVDVEYLYCRRYKFGNQIKSTCAIDFGLVNMLSNESITKCAHLDAVFTGKYTIGNLGVEEGDPEGYYSVFAKYLPSATVFTKGNFYFMKHYIQFGIDIYKLEKSSSGKENVRLRLDNTQKDKFVKGSKNLIRREMLKNAIMWYKKYLLKSAVLKYVIKLVFPEMPIENVHFNDKIWIMKYYDFIEDWTVDEFIVKQRTEIEKKISNNKILTFILSKSESYEEFAKLEVDDEFSDILDDIAKMYVRWQTGESEKEKIAQHFLGLFKGWFVSLTKNWGKLTKERSMSFLKYIGSV